ncbi:hypothetical protein AB0I77_47135 [Streptomyces sp. NPDC050619]|uniref:hypothetical protein n=1 Tax=Streptomyces sp. NPDC050619 TaxID=3157214 RepID=UPI0034317CF8
MARLHTSQPPLSQAVLTLERELGATVASQQRACGLTQASDVLLRHCRHLVQDADRARAAAQRARDGFSGPFIIGAVASAFTDVPPTALRENGAIHPEVDLRLIEVDTETASRAVQDRAIDIAWSAAPPTTPASARRRCVMIGLPRCCR